MATRIRNTPTEKYFVEATNRLMIDMDRKGTFARVISEKICDKYGKRIAYRVNIDESNPRNVHATGCQCADRNYRKLYCKHMQVVDRFYGRLIHGSNDKTYEQAMNAILDADYVARGKEIAERGTLNGNRKIVPTIGKSAIESSLAVRGWMR